MKQQPLGYNILSLKLLLIWPTKNKICFLYLIENLLFNIINYISCITASASFYRQFIFGFDDMDSAVGSFVGFVDFIGSEYMKIFFWYKLEKIKTLILSIDHFKAFCAVEKLRDTENKIRKYTKALMLYCMFGNVVNSIIPLVDREACNERRRNDPNRIYDPCGLMCHCWCPIDVSGRLFPYLYFAQLYSCIIVSTSVIAITMMLIGVLLYTIDQLHNFRTEIKKLKKYIDRGEKLKPRVNFVIQYHIKIVEYSADINEAFGGMMILHLTLTSIVISLLSFQILTNVLDNLFSEALRFNLQVFGWLTLVVLVCYHGQLLVDESTAVAQDIYDLPWFHAPVEIQKDLKLLLMRAQKSLVLSAANLGNMSLAKLLSILYNAYSNFMFLLNIRS